MQAFFCKAGAGRCELPTITASQLAAAAILSAYTIARTYSVASAKSDPVAAQLTAASAMTIVYIFLCFWLVEEQLIGDLRALKRLFSWLEFGFRIVLLIAIALMPNFVDAWIPAVLDRFAAEPSLKLVQPAGAVLAPAATPMLSPTTTTSSVGTAPVANVSVDQLFTPADSIVLFLAFRFVMFLVWDAIVYFGAPDGNQQARIRAIPKQFSRTDFIGLTILVAVEILRFISANLASLALLVFIVFSFYLVARVARDSSSGDSLLTRLRNRELLR